MYISKFKIRNYKSYLDSGEVSLGPGINIITGQNNVGKTAMLNALSLNFENNSHVSIKTKPTSITPTNTPSLIEIELCLSKEELKTLIFDFFTRIHLPYPSTNNPNIYNGAFFFNEILEEKNIICATLQANGGVVSAYLKKTGPPNNQTSTFAVNKNTQTLQLLSNDNSLSSFIEIVNHCKNRIYFFHAERFNIGVSQFGVNKILTPNATNLPEVLENLREDHFRFERYNQIVKKVFPQIFRIGVRAKENNRVEIVVWNEDPMLERSDLVVPLSESGTGLSQVLAILYVVLTSDIPKVIIIDEPNSFLHPGASRKLIEILKEHPQHQFIISTHSPSTIAAANPKTINIIRTQNAQSFIESIDVNETNKQQLYLAEIGAKLSDVFGADNILWVEGKTEEICFPKIIEATEGISLMGTSILGVKNTGDFQKKNSELIFQIYEKLSKGKGLMPAAVGFIFDKEEHTEKEMQDLKRRSSNKVGFTNRMMYESYLLNSDAIFNVLASVEEINDIDITKGLVDKWIEENRWNKEFIKSKYTKDHDLDIWLQKVHAADFLDGLFSELTNTRLKYDKIKHSVALTECILQNSPSDFLEIQDLLHGFLKEN